MASERKRRPDPDVVKIAHIAAWLRNANLGKKILEEAVGRACLSCQRLREFETRCLQCEKRRKVLVVCGITEEDRPWVEVYCGKRVDAMICQRVTVHAANEVLAEELLELRLPLAYRELFVPRKLKKVLVLDRGDIADEAGRMLAGELLRELVR
jgi:hypothetical protein